MSESSDDIAHLDDYLVSIIIEFLPIDDEMVRFAKSSERFGVLVTDHVTAKINQFWQTEIHLKKIVHQAPVLLKRIPKNVERFSRVRGNVDRNIDFLRDNPHVLQDIVPPEMQIFTVDHLETLLSELEVDKNNSRNLLSLTQHTMSCYQECQDFLSLDCCKLSTKEKLDLSCYSVEVFGRLQNLTSMESNLAWE